MPIGLTTTTRGGGGADHNENEYVGAAATVLQDADDQENKVKERENSLQPKRRGVCLWGFFPCPWPCPRLLYTD